MPMFIPVIVAFASVGAGVVTGFAAYAAVAGAVLSTVGALTGNKDLQRIGAFVGIVGGISNIASGAASGAEAVSGMDLAADAAAGTANNVVTAGEAVGAAQSMGDIANTAALSGVGTTTPPAIGPPDPTGAGGVVGVQPSTSLADIAAKTADPNALTTTAPTTPAEAVTTQAASPLGKAASNYTASDLSSWWDKAMAAGKDIGKGVGDWAQKNPLMASTLVNVGGKILSAVNDPQAEALEYQKSLMEMARRNINSPVVLGYNKPK